MRRSIQIVIYEFSEQKNEFFSPTPDIHLAWFCSFGHLEQTFSNLEKNVVIKYYDDKVESFLT